MSPRELDVKTRLRQLSEPGMMRPSVAKQARFHFLMYGDVALIGEWGVNSDEYMHVQMPPVEIEGHDRSGEFRDVAKAFSGSKTLRFLA